MREGRTVAEALRGRRRRAHHWVRKGGLFPLGLLAVFAVVLGGIAALSRWAPGFGEGPWTWATTLSLVLYFAVVGLCVVAATRWSVPWTVSGDNFPEVHDAVAEWGLRRVDPKTLDFNRRLVAGEFGDGHRGVAVWEGPGGSPLWRVAIHGVSKNSVDLDKVGKRIRHWEIPYLLMEARLDGAWQKPVVAVLVDDPPSPLEPDDATGVRFESSAFNQAVCVMSDDARAAHFLFDPRLLESVLELERLRPRLLWEGSTAMVSVELKLIGGRSELQAVAAILERMVRNSSLRS